MPPRKPERNFFYMKIKIENYIQVQGWMRTKLELSGNTLLTYAIIYGFCQDGEGAYTGSISYISDWLGCSRSTTIRILQCLTDQGLIIKLSETKNNITFNTYKISEHPVSNWNWGGINLTRGGGINLTPNNTILDNTIINMGSSSKSKGKIFKAPTLDEVILYVFNEKKYTKNLARKIFDYYSVANWHDSKGDKIKNWKQKIQFWFTEENRAKYKDDPEIETKTIEQKNRDYKDLFGLI